MNTFIKLSIGIIFSFFILVNYSFSEENYSLNEEIIDETGILYGTPKEFSNPAYVNMEHLLESTDEYQKIKKENIKSGTGEYWLILNDASEKVNTMISNFIEENDYDIIFKKEYATNLNLENIEIEDITNEILGNEEE